MPSSHKTNRPQRPPVVDEWGIYDPEQAGLAAVLQRLDARGGGQGVSAADAAAMAASMRDANALSIKEKK